MEMNNLVINMEINPKTKQKTNFNQNIILFKVLFVLVVEIETMSLRNKFFIFSYTITSSLHIQFLCYSQLKYLNCWICYIKLLELVQFKMWILDVRFNLMYIFVVSFIMCILFLAFWLCKGLGVEICLSYCRLFYGLLLDLFLLNLYGFYLRLTWISVGYLWLSTH